MLMPIALRGFRSFGADPQFVRPGDRVTIIVGQNNSGKSNVLRFLSTYYSAAVRAARNGQKLEFADLDVHRGVDDVSSEFWIGYDLERVTAADVAARVIDAPTGNQVEAIEALLLDPVLHDDGVSWFRYRLGLHPSGQVELDPGWIKKCIDDALGPQRWSALWQMTNPGYSGGGMATWVPETLRKLTPVVDDPPAIHFIPAVREVRPGDGSGDFSGIGIVNRLAELQNPPHNQQDKRVQFETINAFLRTLTGDQEAKLEVPYQRDTINVFADGRWLPLEALGTGLHEVVIIAAAATVLRDVVLCIEEPELHLHPLLQKKLMDYLVRGTANSYVISTHSAHLVDTPSSVVIHAQLAEGSTVLSPAVRPNDFLRVCGDLGYRAADLLQANAIVWVEGPSDRIYIRHWISAVSPDLIEGLHYSVMMYGGVLLSHLSADEDPVDDFIQLRRLNRYSAIVMDSDRDAADDPLNATKTRVCTEFEEEPGLSWVTGGRTIENYLTQQMRIDGLTALYGTEVTIPPAVGQWDRAYLFESKGDLKTADKVRLARYVAARDAVLGTLDLKEHVEELATFIRAANGLC